MGQGDPVPPVQGLKSAYVQGHIRAMTPEQRILVPHAGTWHSPWAVPAPGRRAPCSRVGRARSQPALQRGLPNKARPRALPAAPIPAEAALVQPPWVPSCKHLSALRGLTECQPHVARSQNKQPWAARVCRADGTQQLSSRAVLPERQSCAPGAWPQPCRGPSSGERGAMVKTWAGQVLASACRAQGCPRRCSQG